MSDVYVIGVSCTAFAKRPDASLAENGGGVIGFDEAACSVIILQAPSRGRMLPGV